MAVVAGHLDAPVLWADQVGLHMQVVVETDLALICVAPYEQAKFRMVGLERMDRCGVLRFSDSNLQVGVALRARVIRCRSQSHRPSVLQMARRACGREGLICLMDGRIVAAEAGVVGHGLGKDADARHVAEVALLREDRVRSGKRAAGIYLLISLDALSEEPSQG